ncbi:MAG: YraN family protein [Caulobacteraceae bacterium]
MSRPAAPMRSKRGAQARLAGRRGEILAALWLMIKGYRILGLRLGTPQAEIDILAEKGDLVVVVEVKSRTTSQEALEAVRPEQQRRLLRAAEAILAQRRGMADRPIRLDLIALAPGRAPRHIRGAWLGT